ncbi:3189_t:CDS:2 [Funneliformis geosporum]|nr:3189_t:CDS:2 [Funneliformis geosporum]
MPMMNEQNERALIKILLNIGEEKLEGSPNLKEFINLTEISCQKNQLSNLDFLLTLSNPEKLIYLDVSCNNFPPCDLIIFSRFKNLKTLVIDNSPFYGSLKPLENLHKLEFLYINDTDITEGLKYLPDRLIRSLEEENIKIESLEDEIFHLTNLIKQQKKKIVQAYLRFNPEKELLRKLIEAHLQITKWRKKEAPLTEYETELTEYKKIRSDLKSKLNEDKLKEKSLLLEEKNKLPQITNNEQGNYLTNNMETEVDKQISFYQPREKNINRVDGLKEIVYKKTNQVQEEKEFERLFGEVRSKIKKIEKLRLKKNREKLSSKKEIEKNDVLQYLLNQKKSKKDQRNQIFTIIYQQLTNQDFEFWLKEFTELKKVLNSLKNKETNSGVEE